MTLLFSFKQIDSPFYFPSNREIALVIFLQTERLPLLFSFKQRDRPCYFPSESLPLLFTHKQIACCCCLRTESMPLLFTLRQRACLCCLPTNICFKTHAGPKVLVTFFKMFICGAKTKLWTAGMLHPERQF